MLSFQRDSKGPVSLDLANVVVAGMTMRDQAAIRHHVEEMKAIGVRLPATFPFYFRLSADVITQAERIQVLGTDSTGEVEPVVLMLDDGCWLGVGSDHTCRKTEAFSINVSKQMCPHPIGRDLWHLSEVSAHWDKLMIRSWTTRHGKRELYQEGTLSLMRHPDELIEGYARDGGCFDPGTALFCGTLGALGPIEHAELFEIEIEDPVLKRRIGHKYAIESLPAMP